MWLGTTPGPVLLVSGAEGLVFLNNYEEKAEAQLVDAKRLRSEAREELLTAATRHDLDESS